MPAAIERVRARLRRPSLERGEVVKIGALRIHRVRREVHVRDQRVELTRVEFDFLATLAERPGQAMTRSVLAERALDRGTRGRRPHPRRPCVQIA